MKIKAESLTDRILALAGENPVPSAGFAFGMEGLDVREMALGLIEDSAREVMAEVPIDMIDTFSHLPDDVGRRPDGSGYVMLPPDFLRLAAFRMSDWNVTVTQPAEEWSAEHLLQQSPWPGLRGRPDRPVCVVSRRGVGYVLEFWSSARNARVAEGLYVAVPKTDRRGYISLPVSCVAAVAETAASMLRKILVAHE